LNPLKKIILIGNYANDRQESMQRFSSILFQSLKNKGYSVELVKPDTVFGKLKPGGTGIGKWLGYVDKFIIFPFTLRQLARNTHSTGNTVFHICDHSNAMFGSHLRNLPYMVTCNDMLAIRSALGEFPENETKVTGKILQKWILKSLRKTPHIACISRATQEDTIRLAERVPSNSIVVHMGLNYPYQPLEKVVGNEILHPLWQSRGLAINLATPFLFHVGGSKWYKNREGLISIYKELKDLEPSTPPLLIAGKPHSTKVKNLIKTFNIESSIHYVGEVTNKELNALYSAAQVFLFPSLAEGFGWPIIEAQASGCPVVTSNRKPMTEIGGESTVYVDPESSHSSAVAIFDLMNESKEIREHRIQTGIHNAAMYSTEIMVNNYISEYEKLLLKGVSN